MEHREHMVKAIRKAAEILEGGVESELQIQALAILVTLSRSLLEEVAASGPVHGN